MAETNAREMLNYPIPRYVHTVNAIAERAGLQVTLAVETDEDGDPCIVATWRGTAEQLRATGLLQPSARIPLKRGYWTGGCISGRLVNRSGNIEARAEFGAAPVRIELQGEIEVAHYRSGTEYHGLSAALLAAGLCDSKQLPMKKPSMRSHDFEGKKREWIACRYPDGSFSFYIESEERQMQRRAEHEELMKECRKHRVCSDISECASPDEWLGGLETMACHMFKVALDFSRLKVETKAGMRYTADAVQIAGIINAVELAAQRIRNVSVTVERLEPESTPVAREKIAQASADRGFQRFISTAIGGSNAR